MNETEKTTDNWFPMPSAVKLRKGFKQHCVIDRSRGNFIKRLEVKRGKLVAVMDTGMNVIVPMIKI